MAIEPQGQTLYVGPHLEVFIPAELVSGCACYSWTQQGWSLEQP